MICIAAMLGSADVGAFSRDNFEVHAWVNRVLDDRPGDSSLDAHISAVSMKLQVCTFTHCVAMNRSLLFSLNPHLCQILSADMNDELERSMADVSLLLCACDRYPHIRLSLA